MKCTNLKFTSIKESTCAFKLAISCISLTCTEDSKRKVRVVGYSIHEFKRSKYL